MKTVNIIEMTNGFLVQIGVQQGGIAKSLVFQKIGDPNGEHIVRMLEAIHRDLSEPPVLTVAPEPEPEPEPAKV